MVRFLLHGGLVALITGSVLHRNQRWAKPVLTLGIIGMVVGLFARGVCFGDFRPELVTEETLLICSGWGSALIVFLHRGGLKMPLLISGIVCCLIPASVLGLALPWPTGAIDLKVQHVSAPLFFFFEALGTILLSLASLMAIELLFYSDRRSPTGNQSSRSSITGLPSLMNRLLFWGFVAFSMCQAVGAYWAWVGWSAPFHWSDRHLLSAAVWCFYGGALHFPFTTWSPRFRYGLLSACLLPLLFLQLVPDLLRILTDWAGGAP